ncbi:hypothetical protein, partial [Steroidobacter sp.]|uniref:hypothetical protein n=1 Tax=Steroidobacter sp. TaxID=1978227 RepID=UPI001A5AFA83
HVDANASIPMFFNPDGTVYYVYLYLKLDALKSNYSQTVTWELHGEELCAVKSVDLMTCFTLPQLSVGEVADTTVRAVDRNGGVKWRERAKIMLLNGPSA